MKLRSFNENILNDHDHIIVYLECPFPSKEIGFIEDEMFLFNKRSFICTINFLEYGILKNHLILILIISF